MMRPGSKTSESLLEISLGKFKFHTNPSQPDSVVKTLGSHIMKKKKGMFRQNVFFFQKPLEMGLIFNKKTKQTKNKQKQTNKQTKQKKKTLAMGLFFKIFLGVYVVNSKHFDKFACFLWWNP